MAKQRAKVIWKKKLVVPDIEARYVNGKVMTFAHYEFWRLYMPYVPMETGTLWASVEITEEHVRHTVPYAANVYYGDYMNFYKDRHPLACARWDVAAMQTQMPKLIRSVESYMKRQGSL